MASENARDYVLDTTAERGTYLNQSKSKWT